MKNVVRAFARVLRMLGAWLMVAVCYGQTGSNSLTGYEELYAAFMSMTPDPSKGMVMNNVTITREVATFHFEEGTLFLCKPVHGFTCAAIFTGTGTFSFAPPLSIEEDQLFRFYEKKTLNERFDRLFMIFGDSTLRELIHKGAFTEMKIPRQMESQIGACLKYMGDDEGESFNPEIIKPFLEFQSSELFYAQIETRDVGPLFFEIDPSANEEVSLMRKEEGEALGHHLREIISQFHQQKCYLSGAVDHGSERDFIRITNYSIESTIADNFDFSASAAIQLTSLKDNQQWLYFYLFEKLQVDSIFSGSGKRVSFFKGKENRVLWVKADPPLSAGKLCSLRVYYHGELLKRNQDLAWIYILSPDYWFPRYGYHTKTTYDLTFHTPARLKFVAIGDNVSANTQKDVFTSRWVTRKPVGNASFNIGDFKEHKIESPSVPPITVYISEYGHRKLARQGITSKSDMEKNVGADVTASTEFYQAIFGKCPAEKLYATEIPYFHGEAFLGLIHLSWVTFQTEDQQGREGEEEIFRAHEVAHQWWGIGVGFRTYHDQWVSEAFADYSGLWYLQASVHDNKKFFAVLKRWKEKILSNRKFLFGSGQEAGPIWLGRRTQSSSTQGDYDLIIYKKGAWVLHMLRNMMLDLKTMNEDRFKNVMKKFYTTYLDSLASTSDFQQIVETEMGIDMGWFFKEWLFDTRIPHFKFAYRSQTLPDGKYKVSCKVWQENVADDFQMVVPLYVDFGDKKFVRLRVFVKGPVSEFDLPVLPLKPEKIIFNDLESVLCEVEDVGWENE